MAQSKATAALRVAATILAFADGCLRIAGLTQAQASGSPTARIDDVFSGVNALALGAIGVLCLGASTVRCAALPEQPPPVAGGSRRGGKLHYLAHVKAFLIVMVISVHVTVAFSVAEFDGMQTLSMNPFATKPTINSFLIGAVWFVQCKRTHPAPATACVIRNTD